MRPSAAILLAILLAVSGLGTPAGMRAAAAPTPARTADPRAGAPGQAATTAPIAAQPAVGRYIVVLRSAPGRRSAAVRAAAAGIRADRTFGSVVHGFSARLSPLQVARLRADPGVAEVVPDETISATGQFVPRGIRRIGGPGSLIARIDGVDDRVDVDVAIVDTGVAKTHEDLNVVGGISCATDNPDNWGDPNGHGTHVAGTVAALDNDIGVVGVAPGARIWSVRILDAAGNGLLSWYVCGLDWIASQRDPADASRPQIEVANMSVAKSGADDHNCGLTSGDVMHQAVCRLVAAGTTVVAAAGNDHANAATRIPAAYDEVITVSALADTDGLPGGLGGNLCYSWSTYDKDDTFADFSNYGADVDLIAPGKCTWSTLPGNAYGYMSGTSMAAPHVTGAAALWLASRPGATPAQVKAALVAAGTADWATGTDPDSVHEPLLDVTHLVAPGDFTVDATPQVSTPAVAPGAGASLNLPVRLYRAEDFTAAVDLTVSPDGPLTADVSTPELTGAGGVATSLAVTVPPGTPSGTYALRVTASDGSRSRSSTVDVVVDGDPPTATPPVATLAGPATLAGSAAPVRMTWSAPVDAGGAIAGQEARWSVDGVDGPVTALGSGVRTLVRLVTPGHPAVLAVRARDAAGNWSAWAASAPAGVSLVQSDAAAVGRAGTWRTTRSTIFSGGTALYSKGRGTALGYAFTGRGIAVVASHGPRLGQARISVDGVLVATVNLHAATVSGRRIVFARSWPDAGRHRVRVEVVGTAWHPYVNVDAFVVMP